MQRFKDSKVEKKFFESKPPKFKDSKIQRLKRSSLNRSPRPQIQRFEDSKIQRFKGWKEVLWIEAPKIQRFRGSKTDIYNRGQVRNHFGTKEIVCVVKAMIKLFHHFAQGIKEDPKQKSFCSVPTRSPCHGQPSKPSLKEPLEVSTCPASGYALFEVWRGKCPVGPVPGHCLGKEMGTMGQRFFPNLRLGSAWDSERSCPKDDYRWSRP